MYMDWGSMPVQPHILDSSLTLLPRCWSDIGNCSRSCGRVLAFKKVSIQVDLPHREHKQLLGRPKPGCGYREANGRVGHGTST